jgi:hypothetical protein
MMHQSIKYSIYKAVIIVIVFNDFFTAFKP